VSEEPETGTKEETSNDEDPDGCVDLGLDLAGEVGVVSSNPGADSIGNIIGAYGMLVIHICK